MPGGIFCDADRGNAGCSEPRHVPYVLTSIPSSFWAVILRPASKPCESCTERADLGTPKSESYYLSSLHPLTVLQKVRSAVTLCSSDANRMYEYEYES